MFCFAFLHLTPLLYVAVHTCSLPLLQSPNPIVSFTIYIFWPSSFSLALVYSLTAAATARASLKQDSHALSSCCALLQAEVRASHQLLLLNSPSANIASLSRSILTIILIILIILVIITLIILHIACGYVKIKVGLAESRDLFICVLRQRESHAA